MSAVGQATMRPLLVAVGIERGADERADEVAVTDQRQSITFGELDARVAALAARLAEQAAPQLVDGARWLPVIIDRSVESVIALHAVIRAGLPFTPIESTLPTQRVAELFARIGHPAVAVVADAAATGLLPSGVTPIAAEGPIIDRLGSCPIDPDDPGVVVFTSGSTGQPKGVIRPWASLDGPALRRLEGLGESTDAPRRVATLRPFSFVSGLNHLATPAVGDSLHIVDPSAGDVHALVERLARDGVTEASFGAAIAGAVINGTSGDRCLPALSRITMGGQPAGWELVAPLRTRAALDLTILSNFASSETGRVLSYEIGPDHPIGRGPLPIGRVGDSPRVRLEPIDDDGTLVELLVARPSALGYLDDPQLTAERFVPDADGVIWWHSGDLLHLDDDGVLSHRGRVDDMVKVNGLLVEPSEAERALREVPGIRSAAALMHTTPSGASRLVGHVVVGDPQLTPEAVRAHLGSRLPKHLVPAMLVRHDELPINERGKIDREALRGSEPVRWRVSAPRRSYNELEIWLAGALARVLDLGEVGPDDDVWEAGLDSLGAVELCAVIADAGFPNIDPTTLLAERTPSALATRLSTDRPASPSCAIVLNGNGTQSPLFVVPGGGGTALAFRSLAQELGADHPVVVVEPRGMHRRGPIDRTIDDTVAHIHNEIRAWRAPGKPLVLAGYSAGATAAFELARQLLDAGDPVHLLLLDGAPGAVQRPGGDGIGARLRRRNPLDHVRELPRIVRHRWLVLRPGRPSYSQARYSAFRTIIGRANAAYRPTALSCPATLVHPVGSAVIDRCTPWLAALSVHEVGGDHHSMLQPPHVHETAEIVRAIIATPDQRS